MYFSDLELNAGAALFQYVQAAVEELGLFAVFGLAGEGEQVGQVLASERPQHLFVFDVAVRHRRHFSLFDSTVFGWVWFGFLELCRVYDCLANNSKKKKLTNNSYLNEKGNVLCYVLDLKLPSERIEFLCSCPLQC